MLGGILGRIAKNPINSLMDPAEALGLNPHQLIPGMKGPGEALGMQGISGSVKPPTVFAGRKPDISGAIDRGQMMGQRQQADALRGGAAFGGR